MSGDDRKRDPKTASRPAQNRGPTSMRPTVASGNNTTDERPRRDRAAERDHSRTGRVAGAALRLAHGNVEKAAAELRVQAAESLTRAHNALTRHGDSDRCREWMDHAERRLRAADGIEQGDWTP